MNKIYTKIITTCRNEVFFTKAQVQRIIVTSHDVYVRGKLFGFTNSLLFPKSSYLSPCFTSRNESTKSVKRRSQGIR